MDSKDRDILQVLQEDGRLTNQEVAKKVNLSPSPCLRRLRQLEDAGVITGYTALVDQKAWGMSLTAFVRIRIIVHSQETVERFEAAIAAMDQVMDAWLMTGDDDYMLRVVAKNLDDYEAFVRTHLQKTPGIAAISTSFAYGHVKSRRVYPDVY